MDHLYLRLIGMTPNSTLLNVRSITVMNIMLKLHNQEELITLKYSQNIQQNITVQQQ